MDFGGAPQALDLLLEADQREYAIRRGYTLVIDVESLDYLPAILHQSGTEFVSFDISLLKRAWEIMQPRKSKMLAQYYYVNERLGVCYPLPRRGVTMADCNRIPVLTYQAFQFLYDQKDPFIWTRGASVASMRPRAFANLVRFALPIHTA